MHEQSSYLEEPWFDVELDVHWYFMFMLQYDPTGQTWQEKLGRVSFLR